MLLLLAQHITADARFWPSTFTKQINVARMSLEDPLSLPYINIHNFITHRFSQDVRKKYNNAFPCQSSPNLHDRLRHKRFWAATR
jgi:hypothetical protein